jgi:hypothetical protein
LVWADNRSGTRYWAWLLLLSSSSTLLCCALPMLLVALGFGAVSASLFASLPVLVTLTLYKQWLFAISACVLALAAWLLIRSKRSCPSDPALAARCAAAHRWNVRVLFLSAGVWCIGFAAAYLVLPLYLHFFAD